MHVIVFLHFYPLDKIAVFSEKDMYSQRLKL